MPAVSDSSVAAEWVDAVPGEREPSSPPPIGPDRSDTRDFGGYTDLWIARLAAGAYTPARDIFSAITRLPAAPAVVPRGPVLRMVRAARHNLFEFIPAAAYETGLCHFRFGGKRFVHVADPRLLTEILVDNPHIYEKGDTQREILENTRGYGPLTAKDADWTRQRKMFAAFFTPRFVDRVEVLLDAVCARTVDGLCGPAGGEKDFLNEMKTAVLLSVYGSLLPELVETDLETEVESGAALPLEDDLLAAVRLAAAAKARMARMPESLVPPLLRRRSAAGARTLGARADAILARVVAAADDKIHRNRDGLLYQILHTDVLPENKKIEYLRSMLVTGQYATDSFLTTMFTVLALNPQFQERLRHLLASADPAYRARFDEARRLFEHECLRLYPPIPLFERAAPREMPGGVRRPEWLGEAQSILIAPWIVHRHHRLWLEPDRFDPERFVYLDERDLKGQFLPFGMGKRICSGRVYAHMIADKLLANVLSRLRLSVAGAPPVVRSKQTVELTPRPRITATAL